MRPYRKVFAFEAKISLPLAKAGIFMRRRGRK
jgi:hypothetical protein